MNGKDLNIHCKIYSGSGGSPVCILHIKKTSPRLDEAGRNQGRNQASKYMEDTCRALQWHRAATSRSFEQLMLLRIVTLNTIQLPGARCLGRKATASIGQYSNRIGLVMQKKVRHAPVKMKTLGCRCARRASRTLSCKVAFSNRCLPAFFMQQYRLLTQLWLSGRAEWEAASS